MKILTEQELMQVSGSGSNWEYFALFAILNMGFASYVLKKIDEMQNDLDFVLNWSIYHDAQLSMLPNYSTVSAMPYNQVWDMVSS